MEHFGRCEPLRLESVTYPRFVNASFAFMGLKIQNSRDPPPVSQIGLEGQRRRGRTAPQRRHCRIFAHPSHLLSRPQGCALPHDGSPPVALPIGVCAARGSPLRLAQILGKVHESHPCGIPTRRVCSQWLSLEAGTDPWESS